MDILVFQYGSNMSAVRLNAQDRLCGDAIPVGIASTAEDFELEFDIFSKGANCAAADIVSGNGRKIWGVLYRIPERLIRRDSAAPRKSLDAIEGEGSNYSRIEIAVRNPAGRLLEERVITYIGLARRFGIQTSADYVRHILNGLREHAMPAEYAAYVRSRIIANNPDLRGALGL